MFVVTCLVWPISIYYLGATYIGQIWPNVPSRTLWTSAVSDWKTHRQCSGLAPAPRPQHCLLVWDTVWLNSNYIRYGMQVFDPVVEFSLSQDLAFAITWTMEQLQWWINLTAKFGNMRRRTGFWPSPGTFLAGSSSHKKIPVYFQPFTFFFIKSPPSLLDKMIYFEVLVFVF